MKFCLDDRAAASLRNEADKLSRVMCAGRHEGIVPLRNIYLKATPPCLEYEYVAGGDLAGLIQQLHEQKQATPDYLARWMLHLAGTVRFAHELTPPLVHRDLKPANILVQRGKDGKLSLRVADFGISEVAAAQRWAARRIRKWSRRWCMALTRPCTPRRSRWPDCQPIRATTFMPWALSGIRC